MLTYRSYKYRLYPDAEARAYFARCFGATRYCYNLCVRAYDTACSEGRQVSGYDIMALAREQMKDVKWLSGVDSEIKESAPMRFDNALGKYKRHEAERPREHKKGERPCMSYTTGGTIHVDFKHHLVQLPRIGIVRACLHRTFQGEITSATVKREADGNYYICINVCNDEPAVPLKPHTAKGTVGIDVGLRHLATLSTGKYIDLPDSSRDEARLKFLKERHKKQKSGSRRYNRTAQQIARLNRHLANVTKDAQHKAAVMLCRKYDTICMETLDVAGMKRGTLDSRTPTDILFNAKLHHAALALFIGRVKKKAEDTGTNFVQIDRFEPTTKKCHVCGYVLPVIGLDASEWTCHECGTHHDRDVNAAINIRRNGLEELKAKRKKNPNNTLPPAEGKVKPEKKATAGCDLRTGKVTAKFGPKIKTQLNRQPKAQIADGSAPPRFFNKFRYAMPDELRYFRQAPLAKEACISVAQLRKWMEQITTGDIPFELESVHNHILAVISQVADDLRHTKTRKNEREYNNDALRKMNKMFHADWLIGEEVTVTPRFSEWRSKERTPKEIRIINRIVTVNFPDRLDDMVSKLKAFALAKPDRLKQSPYAATNDNCMLKKLYPYSHVKAHRITKQVGVASHAFDLWLSFKYKWGEKYFCYDDILRFLQSYGELANRLRSMEITDFSKRFVNRRLKEFEKELWMYNILWDAHFYPNEVYDDMGQEFNYEKKKKAYEKWRAEDITTGDIYKLNQVICYELPELMEKDVAEKMAELKREIEIKEWKKNKV